MKSPAIALALLALALPASAAPAAESTWNGSFRLPAGAEPVSISVRLRAAAATVTLGAGHAAAAPARVTRRAGEVRITLPGRPQPLVLTLTRHGATQRGEARQGATRGTVSLRPGRRVLGEAAGLYRTPTGHGFAVVRFLDNGGRPVVVDLDSGRWGGALDPGAARVPLRQEEVRFPARGAVLAGTLTLPRGPGPFPAAVYVHGSGRAGRDFAQHVGVLLAFRGIALLAYDKRGVGQSTGSYPGERATPAALATLTGDAEAAVRFLAAQPEVDRSRLGLYGLSQGGWIVPRAAAELAGTVSWALILSGPLVSQGEADDFESLAQGAPDAELPALEAQAHASGPSGFDPAPWVRRLRIPVLWLYGGRDHNQPGGSSLAILETIRSETGVDLQWRRFPTADHGLFDTDPGPRRHPAELFPALTAWLVAKGLAST